MKVQMQISNLGIIFFPEIFLAILISILILVGLFQKKNSFKNISNLSSITLLVVFFCLKRAENNRLFALRHTN